MKLGRGAVVVVELDPTIGHEQRGVRPCIVVSDPDVIGDPLFWFDPEAARYKPLTQNIYADIVSGRVKL